MKSKVLSIVLFSASLFGGAAFASQSGPFPLLPEKVFTPYGFDDNDRVEVVLHGHFPDSCFRAGPAKAIVSKGRILVSNIAYRDAVGPCVKTSVPWTTSAAVGQLPVGKYPVYVRSPSGSAILFENLEVTRAKSRAIDDHLYAYVNGALVNIDPATKIPSITLSGSFGTTCMYIRDIKVERAKENVVTILPIVDLDETKPCAYPFAPIPFEKRFRMAAPLEARTTLFHVRSLNGQALNRVVEF